MPIKVFQGPVNERPDSLNPYSWLSTAGRLQISTFGRVWRTCDEDGGAAEGCFDGEAAVAQLAAVVAV